VSWKVPDSAWGKGQREREIHTKIQTHLNVLIVLYIQRKHDVQCNESGAVWRLATYTHVQRKELVRVGWSAGRSYLFAVPGTRWLAHSTGSVLQNIVSSPLVHELDLGTLGGGEDFTTIPSISSSCATST
jgi:hypothetical protein